MVHHSDAMPGGSGTSPWNTAILSEVLVREIASGEWKARGKGDEENLGEYGSLNSPIGNPRDGAHHASKASKSGF